MRKHIIIFMVIAALSSFSAHQQKKRVLFFGDSITEAGVGPGGYISKLREELAKKGVGNAYDLVGSGIGGNKIYDLYLRMEDDVLAKKPDVVFIWVGVNDVWHKSSLGTGTDADKFVKFYEAVIKKLQANKIKVYVCTPAAIGEKTDFTNQQDGDLNKYAAIVRDLAAKNNCGIVDLRKAFLKYNLENNTQNKESGVLTSDGVHLNEKGNAFVANEMMNALIK